MDHKSISDYKNERNPYVLDNRILNQLLKKPSSNLKYTLHWKIQVFESNYPFLNSSSLRQSIPDWIDFEDQGDTIGQYLAWWVPNGTRYAEYFSERV